MKNQFFYTRKETLPPIGEDKEVRVKEYSDSFNMEVVVRSIELEDGRRLVLLNDIHERLQKIDQVNKRGEKIGSTKERNTFQSEIFLSKEDGQRFASVTQ